jgi:hypothetical protein
MFVMYLTGNVHNLPLLSKPETSPGSIELEKLLSDAILSSNLN